MMKNSQIVKDWSAVDPAKLFDPWKRDPTHSRQLMTALQMFLTLPGPHVPAEFAKNESYLKKRGLFKAAQAQYFSTLNDFPATPKEAIDKYHELAVYDNGYEQIFKMRDYTDSRRDGFAIDTVAGGLIFRKVLTGETLDVFQCSGEREFVFFDYYGGALGWDRKLFENQDWWGLEENAIEFRNEAYRIRAATFYALIEAVVTAKTAAGLADIAWAAAPDALAAATRGYQAQRDAQTMNNAAQTILLAVQGSGYGVAAQSVGFKILAPIQLRGRIKRALAVNYDVQGSTPVIDWQFDPIYTTMLSVTDHYWVILPGKKAVAGDRMTLTTYADFDMLSRTDAAAGWMAFGGAIADIAQFERCDIA